MSLRYVNGILIDADTLDGDQLATVEGTMDTKVSAEATARDLAIAAAERHSIVRKTSDETVNNSEAMQNDDDLVIAVGANEVWLLDIVLFLISASETPDIDFLFAVPSGGAIRGIDEWCYSSSSPIAFIDFTTERSLAVKADERFQHFRALYIGGASGGSVQLQWAQKTATMEDTKVKAQSLILAHKLA